MRRLAGSAVAIALLAALLALAAEPTGSPTPEAAAGSGVRIASRYDVASVAVLLTVARDDLSLVVAYHEAKGWFAARVDPVPTSVETSWTSTKGGDDIPPLSAAYGRASEGTVRVTWDDGASDTVAVGHDGMWLVARRGQVALTHVERIAPDGTVTAEEGGL